MNREERLEYHRKWRLTHKEQSAGYRKRYYQNRKPVGFCIDCGNPTKLKSARYCQRCYLNFHNPRAIAPYIRTPESNERNSQSHRNLLKDPTVLALYKKNIALATIAPRHHTTPNKCEVVLMGLLNNLYPNEWRFSGDGSFWIGNLNPDFVSNNGKKLVIELFGDYWHNRGGLPYHNSELGRIMYFNSYGYKTLIIWEKELKDISHLIKKIKRWHPPLLRREGEVLRYPSQRMIQKSQF